MTDERRAQERFLARIPLIYAGGNHGLAAKFRGNSETIDVSRGGLRFTIYHAVSESDLLDLEIYLGEGGKPLELVAEVRWKRSLNAHPPNEIGIRFLKVEPSKQRWLARLVKEAEAR